MKTKTTETKVEAPKNETTKRQKRNHKFFLYADGKGLIVMNASEPNFNNGEVLYFESRAKAIFARDFFLKVKLADSIDILTKVA